jgi:hypothetical protein
MIDRNYTLPSLLPGEENWEWCQRAAEVIPPEYVLGSLIDYLDRRERRTGRPAWGLIKKITGHGSGVSAAIAARYRIPIEPRIDPDPSKGYALAVCSQCGYQTRNAAMLGKEHSASCGGFIDYPENHDG